MSTEQQPPTPPAPAAPVVPAPTPKVEPNPLATQMSSVWHDFIGGKLIGYKFMAIGLVLSAALGLYLYLSSTGRTADSAKWFALEKAGSVKQLEEITTNYPNSSVARIARLHLARLKLGPDGIESLGRPALGGNNAAVKNIEEAKSELEKLAEEFKNDPAFRAECLLALAKAEAALLGAEKDGAKGSVDKLLEYLDKLGEIDEKAPWCVDARKFAVALRDGGKPTREELIRVQTELYDLPPPPSPGQFGPGGFGSPGGMGPVGGGIPGF